MNPGVRLERLQELAEDAAHRPHVDLRVVVLLEEDQLGRAVPARDHVLGELTLQLRLTVAPQSRSRHVALGMSGGRIANSRLLLLSVLVVHLARQAEVDDLQLAFVVDQDVGGLEIAMDDVCALAVGPNERRIPAYTAIRTAAGK